MDIKSLKLDLEQNRCPHKVLIFDCSADGTFLAEQYVNAIARILNTDGITIIDDLSAVELVSNMFYVPDNFTHVYYTENLDSLKYTDAELSDYGVYIIASKVDKGLRDRGIYVACPKLEEWCLKDLFFSACEGVDESDLNKIFELLKTNPFRLQQEADRISLFPQVQRKNVVRDFMADGIYDDLVTSTTFDLVNAILHKNISLITTILKDIDKIDLNGFGLASLLYTQFRNVILVQLSKIKTTETTGLPSNQIYAINRYSTGFYSREQLVDIFKFLTEVPTLVKCGKLPSEDMVNYIIIKIMLIGGMT